MRDPQTDELEEMFPGTSEMALQMRAFDWSRTGMGPLETWPGSLRTVLRVMLTSRHPMFLWWGPDLVQFYNDAYRPSFGQDRHQGALGAKGSEFWQEIWPIIGPQIEAVMVRGESTWHEDDLVPILRNGRLEEVYWTYSYSPVLGDDRIVGGTLVIVQETTRRVLTERRMTMLNLLAEQMESQATSVASACEVAADVMGIYGTDFAFSLLYAFDDDGRTLRLSAASGDVPEALRPQTIETHGDTAADPLGVAAATHSGRKEVINDLGTIGGPVVSGPWPEAVETAVVLPIALASGDRTYGALVVGISPHLGLDEGYRTFLDLVTSQIATTIVNARALEQMRAAAALKDQFLGLVSHELRTPIATVIGNGLLLRKRGHLFSDEDKLQALDDIVSEGQKLQRVIENLLLVTSIDKSRGPEFQRVSLQGLIASEIDAFSRRRPERRIVASLEDANKVEGEETLLSMLFENLLSNADKYSPIEAPLGVTMRLGPSKTVEVVVSDNGIGIDPADVKDLFTPFYRTAAARQYSTGMGLGLLVCKRIIEAHGGNIWTSPRPEGGSDFVFSLPLAD